jgi:zinc protease
MVLFFIVLQFLLSCNIILCSKNELNEKINVTGQYGLQKDRSMENNNIVHKKILENGLTVLVHQNKTIPKVSTQIWYNVGSKDERTGEKGIAHLIEHMIFKGTTKLSESDINVITQKLSGYCNAFTSYDYTGYLFDFPTHNWEYALSMMSDCMRNCTFKEEHLNSELKAVIQELKMYKDSYVSDLIEKMTGVIFSGHPYTNPIIGYKHDLWSLKRDTLVDFYKRHYVPNNATLVVVGDVNPSKVFEIAEQKFGNIKPDKKYHKEEFYLPQDIVSKSVTIYRDVQQPIILLSYLIPGAKSKQDYIVDTASWVLGSGRGSRLWRRLVDELQIAVDIETFAYDLFDSGMFFIDVHPVDIKHKQKIMDVINEEIADLALNGPTEQELQRASRKIKMDHLSLLESSHKKAYALGKNYLATGDENYLFNYVDHGEDQDVGARVQELVAKYLRPSVVHTGCVLPIAESEKKQWLGLQKISDIEDKRILSGRERVGAVEPAVCAKDIKPEICPKFNFPKYQTFNLSNGLEVIYFNRTDMPKINIILDLKADSQYDAWDKQGIYNFVSNMMEEGTSKYSAQQLASEIERYGMSMGVSPGYVTMSMLSGDFEHGMQLVHDILTDSAFNKDSVEKVREQLLTEVKHYWDDPSQFIGHVMREQIYPGHPCSKNGLGSAESISKITREDLVGVYQKLISPHGARIAVVGDFGRYNLEEVLEKTLGSWNGPEVADLEYPDLPEIKTSEVNYKINRDQVTLGFVGKSVERSHPDYDKLVLFDQIFTGGALRSMSSQLFALREQSGLFYTIGGSLVAQASKQPGMTMIRTIVSQDRLAEAEKQIKNAIDVATDNVLDDEIFNGINAITSATIDSFDSNRKIAQAFLFLSKYNLPQNYFDERAEKLAKIPVSEIMDAVKKHLSTDKMITVRVGRV